ncbi:uncharacterized protein LOC110018928 [Phalaenopsis equestris]|uniref:uncharacterized protein LOC110018928 n=1 Tax=Phalaenopsis equestris TaxID=78828 RepID=UPI0009E19CA1|nr:uncharacterized protein LOC110018928 [Phalaenopsis equestris]
MASISPTSESQASPSSDYKFKTEKIFRSNSKSNKCIHLIPLLTLLCLLILYLCSHDPNPKGFDGMKIGTTMESRRALKNAGRRKMGNA